MSKYNGIKSADITGLSASLIPGREEVRTSGPKVFLLQLLFCCLFTAAFILLSYFDNDIVKNILDGIYKALTFDFLGTNSSQCIINAWLEGLL